MCVDSEAAAAQRLPDKVSYLTQLEHVFQQTEERPGLPFGVGVGVREVKQDHYQRLVHCILFSGLLKDADATKSALKMAMAIALPRVLAAEMCESLDKDVALPSRATLFRHRSTITWAYCLLRRKLHAKMLGEEGVLRWTMADASPQGNLDYVLVAHSTLPVSRLGQALADANFLYHTCVGDDENDEIESPDRAMIEEAMERLQSLRFQPGAPTAVGSGRAGNKHKLHSVAAL